VNSLNDYPSRKEPFVSDATASDVDPELIEETYSGFTAENRRDHVAVTARHSKQQVFLLPLLIVVCICLGGIVWLVSRSGEESQQSVVLQPLSVVPPQPVSAEPPVLQPSAQQAPPPAALQSSNANVPEAIAQPVSVTSKPVVPPKTDTKLTPAENKQTTPKKVAKPTPTAEKPVKSGGVKWKAKPDNYTVQLIAAFNESGVERIRAQLPPTTPSTIHKTTKDGKPWFILVYGSFATKQEAQTALSELPDAPKKGVKPWVRKQGEVFAQ
jgi:septal ring-binding cell division protein DamX